MAAAQIAERVTNCLTESRPRPTADDFMPRWGGHRDDLDAYAEGDGRGQRDP
jgi:hypothetical protein